MKKEKEYKEKCCDVCRRSNGVCYSCSCHTPQGRAIKENLESMNNGLVFSQKIPNNFN